jgi:hypothetical protein
MVERSVRTTRRRHGQTDLRVSGIFLSDEAVRLIVDEWLIPAMLDDFLRTKILRTEAEQGHNGKPFL